MGNEAGCKEAGRGRLHAVRVDFRALWIGAPSTILNQDRMVLLVTKYA